eukprot:COSAG05_NODE_1213_length_5492_cov_12.157983_3_plen_48_part_00
MGTNEILLDLARLTIYINIYIYIYLISDIIYIYETELKMIPFITIEH